MKGHVLVIRAHLLVMKAVSSSSPSLAPPSSDSDSAARRLRPRPPPPPPRLAAEGLELRGWAGASGLGSSGRVGQAQRDCLLRVGATGVACVVQCSALACWL